MNENKIKSDFYMYIYIQLYPPNTYLSGYRDPPSLISNNSEALPRSRIRNAWNGKTGYMLEQTKTLQTRYIHTYLTSKHKTKQRYKNIQCK